MLEALLNIREYVALSEQIKKKNVWENPEFFEIVFYFHIFSLSHAIIPTIVNTSNWIYRFLSVNRWYTIWISRKYCAAYTSCRLKRWCHAIESLKNVNHITGIISGDALYITWLVFGISVKCSVPVSHFDFAVNHLFATKMTYKSSWIRLLLLCSKWFSRLSLMKYENSSDKYDMCSQTYVQNVNGS